MLDKKTAEPGAAAPEGGKGKAARAPGTTAPTAIRTAARRTRAARAPQPSVHERIQRRAYQLWETEGRPEGRAQAHWHQAELEITRARSRPVSASR
jgi:Protein of unknown function (DUF2934)